MTLKEEKRLELFGLFVQKVTSIIFCYSKIKIVDTFLQYCSIETLSKVSILQFKYRTKKTKKEKPLIRP